MYKKRRYFDIFKNTIFFWLYAFHSYLPLQISNRSTGKRCEIKKEEGYQNRYQNDVIGVFIDIFEHVLYLFLVFLLLTLSRYLFAGLFYKRDKFLPGIYA